MDIGLSRRSGASRAAPFPKAKLAGVALAAFVLSGCASVSIPFGDVFSDRDTANLHTNSTQSVPEPEELATAQEAPLPEALNAVSPVEPPAAPAPQAASPRPADDLVASLPSEPAPRVSLTQSDLNAMGAALTHVLSSDTDAGTFSWSHEATGRSGLMTPFRQLSASDQGACRVVSVEITDGGKDVILLADACLQDGRWVFVTPRAGQSL